MKDMEHQWAEHEEATMRYAANYPTDQGERLLQSRGIPYEKFISFCNVEGIALKPDPSIPLASASKHEKLATDFGHIQDKIAGHRRGMQQVLFCLQVNTLDGLQGKSDKEILLHRGMGAQGIRAINAACKFLNLKRDPETGIISEI